MLDEIQEILAKNVPGNLRWSMLVMPETIRVKIEADENGLRHCSDIVWARATLVRHIARERYVTRSVLFAVLEVERRVDAARDGQ